MNNAATEKMLQAVRTTKDSASRAEREYDSGADLLQMKASRNIDLFGGSAVSQVADIARDARRICDNLYAAYQSLIGMLDAQCRPLLDQGPDYHAVREVRDLIKWLNDESEIENNFTASLNGHGLGGVASGRYIPSIENKMIQSFWENKYATWPGRAEAEAAEQRKRAEEAERRKKAMEERRQQEAAEYEKNYAEWQAKAAVIEKQRSEEVAPALEAAKIAHAKEIKDTHARTVQSATVEKITSERKKSEAEVKLASLGLFQFAEKKATKTLIAQLTAKIADAEARLQSAESTYAKANQNFGAWCEKKKAELQKEAEQKYPLPPKPRKPYVSGSSSGAPLTAMQIANEGIKQEILDGMMPGQLYTIPELIEVIPAIADLSNQRVSALVRQLCSEGRVIRTEDKRMAYFSLAE